MSREQRADPAIKELGPFDTVDPEKRSLITKEAMHLAEIQTTAWLGWLSRLGVTWRDIVSTLDADPANPKHVAARTQRLSEAMGRNATGQAVHYYTAHRADGVRVGFGKVLDDKEGLYLAELDVLPEYQGAKAEQPRENHYLMRRLLLAAVREAQNPNGTVRLEMLEVRENVRAAGLYHRLGFEPTGVMDEFKFYDAAGNVFGALPHIELAAPIATVEAALAPFARD